MSNETKQRKIQLAVVKITKNEIDAALATGNTHAKFTNRGVQKRLMKNQEKVKREQERREAHLRQLNKHRAQLAAQHTARLKREAEGEALRQQQAQRLAAADVAPVKPPVIEEIKLSPPQENFESVVEETNISEKVQKIIDGGDGYAIGVETSIAFINEPTVAEDGIVIDSAAPDTSFMLKD